MDPCYPIPRVQNAELYTRYHALTLPNVHFSGPARDLLHCNMDQVVSFGPPGALIPEEFVLMHFFRFIPAGVIFPPC
jgi:hypothetical protein